MISSCSQICWIPATLSSQLSKVAKLQAEVRTLTDLYRAGGPKAFDAFRDLTALLLSNTVLADSSYVRLAQQAGTKDGSRKVLGGPGGPTDPLELRNGWLLRLSISLFLGEDSNKFLKVEKSAYQYQADPEGDGWVFRYDYLREPGDDPHPTAHLQIRGSLTEDPELPRGLLERVHFPTGRISIEAVIRLLVDQFQCATRVPAEVWRPVLTESERLFAEIAHRPLSGPSA